MKIFVLSLFVSSSVFSAVKIHKHISYFIDIEADKKDVWLSCTDRPESGRSYLGAYVIDADKSYFFFYQRPLTLKHCHEEEKEYHQLMEGGETVRIVGTHPRGQISDPKYKHIKGIPERFTNTKEETSSYFARLQVKNKCKAYLSDHCDLPKNYWAGMIPESLSKKSP